MKLFLHLSRKEQHRRFLKIEKDPFLRWKIKPEDWRHHRQYDEYYQATQEMLEATSTSDAPWTLDARQRPASSEVESFKTIVSAIERRLAEVGKLPPADATVGNLAAAPPKKPAARARRPAGKKSGEARPCLRLGQPRPAPHPQGL